MESIGLAIIKESTHLKVEKVSDERTWQASGFPYDSKGQGAKGNKAIGKMNMGSIGLLMLTRRRRLVGKEKLRNCKAWQESGLSWPSG